MRRTSPSLITTMPPPRSGPRPGVAGAVPLGVLLFAIGTGRAHGGETDAIYQLAATVPGDRLGAAVASVGDLDGDGVGDLAVGAPGTGTTGLPAHGRVLCVSLATGVVIMETDGDSALDRFGTSIAAAGDANGDGTPDLLVGSPAGDPSAGSVNVVSGKDGVVLQVFVGGANGDRFGHAVAAAGDVDADGVQDWIVGAPDADVPVKSAGMARVISGASGATLFDLVGSAFLDRLGTAVAGAGDVDGDGRDDLWIGAPLADAGAMNGGEAILVSGASGAALWSAAGFGVADQVGYWLAGVGDADGDGLPDVAVGAPGDDSGGADAGRVSVLSGWNGAVVATIVGDHPGVGLGPVSGMGDVDGDSCADVAVSAPSSSTVSMEGGAVWICSGKSGAELARFSGTAPNGWLGVAIAGVGDANGDGVPDLVAGAPVHDDHPELFASAWVVSGRALSLTSDGHTLSLTAGGSRVLALDLGASGANAPFALLGSTGGMNPGVSLAGVIVPLNPADLYFAHTLSNPNAPPLAGSFGALNASGRADAVFSLPPGLSSAFVGITVHHAFIALGLRGPVASSAVSITLIP